MKGVYINFILIFDLFLILGCKQTKVNDNLFITVDIMDTPSFKKELILQDIMDVEYIPLETNDIFINQGLVQSIGENIILVKNRNDDGDIFVYDRAGRALRKINRKGQSGEEYSYIFGIVLDEYNHEMYINSHLDRKILVYDLYGNFKRSFKQKEGTGYFFYTDVFDYDRTQLICNNQYSKEIGFILISKQDGSITKEIRIPFSKKKLLFQLLENKVDNSLISIQPGPYSTIIPYNEDWILLELSSDTVYSFSPECNLHPFLVRTPPIQSMVPENFLILRLISDRYYFMETIKNVWDFSENEGFSRTFLMYDKQEKEFFKYNVYNGDYLIKKEVYMNTFRIVNNQNELCCPLEASELVDAYKKGLLKGKLKEIAATLNEESNPVIMLIKHKSKHII